MTISVDLARTSHGIASPTARAARIASTETDVAGTIYRMPPTTPQI
jgi:hypothetical protein